MRTNHRAALWAALLALAAAPASAQGSSPEPPAEQDTTTVPAAATVEELEQRIRILERRLELDREAAATARASAATVSAGADGVKLASADGSYAVTLRGYVQSDGRFFAQGAARSASTLELRRVRPILEATIARHYGFRLMTDFGEGRVVVQDAHLDARIFPFLRVRTGKFKPPVGLERLQSATALTFVERALPTALVPNRDVGVQLWGEFGGGVLGYAAGVFNGVPDGGSADLDTDGRKELAGRVFAQPFRNGSSDLLRGIGIGVAGSTGGEEGTPTATGLNSYRSPGQQVFFSYRSNGQAAGTTVADGDRRRVSPQGWLYYRSIGVIAEHVTSRQQVRRDTAAAELTNTAWQAAASYVLTGEDASYTGVRPLRSFDPAKGAWGAVELTGRLSALEVDGDAFPVFADPERSASAAREWAVGVNWYLNRNVKVTVDYGSTRFAGGRAGGERQTEQGLLTRFQVAF
jgi:phosphate-selective porin OprO/OprP